MYIESISLKNYRNLDTMTVELSKGINIFFGNNAQGKTNFLESIYFCALGRSQRTHSDRELIRFEENQAFIQLLVNNEEFQDKISVHLKKDGKKGIAVNSVNLKRLGDLFGTLLVVIFSPEDLQLVKAGPSERRKFMDLELCQLNKVYYHELGDYYRVLKQRNNLLKSIQRDASLADTIGVWDEQLCTHGTKIMAARTRFIAEINELSGKIYGDITNHKESLRINYKPNISGDEFLSKLKKNLDRDLFLGSTGTGIHKDDILITIDGNDVRTYGSQGQQRSASLAMKLAEIDLIVHEKNQLPVLLLDDVLSELDENRQFFLLDHLKRVQTVITCTGVEDILNHLKQEKETLEVFYVDQGNISKKGAE